MRWTLLTSLAAAGAADETEIEGERQRDDTATGRERAARALAARPTPEAKEAAWAAAVEGREPGLPNAVLTAMAAGFGWAHDPELLRPYLDRYHGAVGPLWAQRTHHIAETLAVGFYPSLLADPALVESSQAWLEEHPEAPAGLRRTVAEHRDSAARAVRAQSIC
jgi:aminopeptidase N